MCGLKWSVDGNCADSYVMDVDWMAAVDIRKARALTQTPASFLCYSQSEVYRMFIFYWGDNRIMQWSDQAIFDANEERKTQDLLDPNGLPGQHGDLIAELAKAQAAQNLSSEEGQCDPCRCRLLQTRYKTQKFPTLCTCAEKSQ